MKKPIILLFMLIMAIGLLAGCGQAKGGGAENAGQSEDAENIDQSDSSERESDGEAAKTGEELASADTQTETSSSDDSADNDGSDDDGNASADDGEADANGEDAEADLPAYTVAALEEPKTMYATNSVNVRRGPSTDYERVGGLSLGQEVTVTGQADTKWYEITYGEATAYVSNRYLQDDKPIEEPAPVLEPVSEQASQPQEPQPSETPAVQPVTEVKTVAGVILVGDSRFVQMQNNVGDNPCTWIAESGKGYNWFNEKAVARIDNVVGKGSKILINLGVNDPGNLQNYITLVNAKAEEWVNKGATVYYASVNPVWENPYVTEEQVEYFNAQLQGGLSSNVHWINSHGYLNSIGYKLVDGLHYNAETYQNLYAYYMNCL